MLWFFALGLNAAIAVLLYIDVSRRTAREWMPLGVVVLVFLAGYSMMGIPGGGVQAFVAIGLLTIAYRVLRGQFPLPSKTCGSCGGDNPLEARGCQHCGVTMTTEPKKICGGCRKVFHNALFCPFCTVPLNDYKPEELKPREIGHVVVCQHCGANNMSRRKECHKCGQNLSDDTPEK